MFKRIWSLIIKEFLAVLQDKKSRYILVIPPLIQLFIFAFAATLDVKNISMGILNYDDGKESFELIQRFRGSPTFTDIRFMKTQSEVKEAIDNQKVMFVLHIDEQFSRNILSSKPANVQLIFDGRKSNTTQIINGYATKIVEQYNIDLARTYNIATPNTVLVQRNWFNPNLMYIWFTVPGLVGILTMLISLILTALSVARERELGTFEQLLVSPLRPFEILIGKIVPGIVISMVEGSIILIAAITLFDTPFRGNIFSLLLATFVFVCAIVGNGLFLSSLCKTQQQALLAVFIFMSPAVTLSGFATPIENMPKFLQTMTLANPLRHYLVIIRGIFVKEMPFHIIMEYIYPIAIIAVVNLVCSTWFFRKKLQ